MLQKQGQATSYSRYVNAIDPLTVTQDCHTIVGRDGDGREAMSIIKRAGSENWYLKIRVPRDLLAEVGKEFVQESLKTADRRKAESLSRIRLGELETEWSRLRANMAAPDGHRPSDIQSLAAHASLAYDPDAFARAGSGPLLPLGTMNSWPANLQELREERSRLSHRAEEITDNYLNRLEIKLTARSREALARGVAERLDAELQTRIGEISGASQATPAGNSVDNVDNLGQEGPLHLSEAINAYKMTDNFQKLGEKTKTEWAKSFRIMLDLFGNREVHTFRPSDGLSFREVVDRLPPRCKSLSGYRMVAEANDGSTRSPGTKNKELTPPRMLFKWLRKSWYVNSDPFEVVPTFNNEGNKTRKKAPFSEAELRTLFLSGAFHEHDVQGVAFWAPLVGLFTGSRRGEVLQLAAEDVIQKEGHWCLKIHANRKNTRLKNPASARIVPISSWLLRNGFLNFVKSNAGNKNGILFKELSWNRQHGWGKNFERRWSDKFSVHLQIPNDVIKGFHSFRHMVTDQLKEARTELGVIDSFLGWSSAERTVAMRDHYGADVSLAKLVEAAKCIHYDWLPEIHPDLAGSILWTKPAEAE